MLWGGRSPALIPWGSQEPRLHGASEDTAGSDILGRRWGSHLHDGLGAAELAGVWAEATHPPQGPAGQEGAVLQEHQCSCAFSGLTFIPQVTAPEHGAATAAPGNSSLPGNTTFLLSNLLHLSIVEQCEYDPAAGQSLRLSRDGQPCAQSRRAEWAQPPCKAGGEILSISRRCSAALAPRPANLHLSEPLLLARADVRPITKTWLGLCPPVLRLSVLSPGVFSPGVTPAAPTLSCDGGMKHIHKS